MKKINKDSIKIGTSSAFIASLCCVGPLILISLGLGTASLALSVGTKKPYFLALGLLFFIVSLIFYIKRQRKKICEGCSTKRQEFNRITSVVLISTIIFLFFYYLLVYILVPYLAPLVYRIFYK